MILLERTERRGEIVNSEQALDNESVRVNNGKSLSKNNYYNPVNY